MLVAVLAILSAVLNIILAVNQFYTNRYTKRSEYLRETRATMEEIGKLIPLEGWSVSTFTAVNVFGKNVIVNKRQNSNRTVTYEITIPVPPKNTPLGMLP